MFGILKKAFKDFKEDGCPRMAAAMAYYTIFALPPLLLLVVIIAGTVVDPQQLQGNVQAQLQDAVGSEGARQIETMLRNARSSSSSGVLATILAAAALVFSATGVFVQLQEALNVAWEVTPESKGGLKRMLAKRLISVTMVVLIAVVLLASVLLSAAVSAFGDLFTRYLPGAPSQAVLQVLQVLVSLVIVGLLFAMIFKIVPDADIAWKDVWVGAGATAVLFVAGKFAIGVYLARSDPGEVFGAAGSLALILVFVYYAAMILFLGAELTQAWAAARGSGIRASA